MTAAELAARLEDETLLILDVRLPEEYSGTMGSPCDPRQGHIPGAQNLPVQELLDRSVDEIRELVGRPPGSEIVAYCHGGSRSAFAAEVLRSAGYEARNYEGSWHEWSRLDHLPAE